MLEEAMPLYEPLDTGKSEIRLLEYVSFSGQPSLRLSSVSLDEKPAYTALSYVWGDASITETILLNGQEFHATKNLFNALQHLQDHWIDTFPGRHPQGFRVWVDALCINQQDVAERNQQVQLMRRIYSSAELVFSWLGTDDEEIGAAFETINLVAHEMDKVVGRRHIGGIEPHDLISWMKDWPQLIVADIGPENDWHSNQSWKSIRSLFNLPYWFRVWVVQEIVLAENLVLLSGKSSVEWIALFLTCSWIGRLKEVRHYLQKPSWMVESAWLSITSSDRVPWHNPMRLMKAKHLQKRPEMLGADEWESWAWELMSWNHTLSATDPKDSIYGLLGLTKLTLIPDYSPEVSVASVYVEYFDQYLAFWKRTGQGKELELLPMAGLHMTMGATQLPVEVDLPTWVPNYPSAWRESNRSFEPITGDADNGLFKSDVLGASVTGDRHLLVSGIRIGKVVRNLPKPTLFDTEHKLVKIIEQLGTSNIRFPNGMTAQEAVFRAVFESGGRGEAILFQHPDVKAKMALGFLFYLMYIDREFAEETLGQQHLFELLGLDDSNSEAFNSSISEVFLSGHGIEGPWLNRFVEWNPEDNLSPEVHDQVKSGVAAWDWRDRGMLHIGGTGDSYIGVSRKDMAEAGDVVCILKGSSVPVILRKTGEETSWSLVGTCWVAGMMNDEAKTMLRDGSVNVERFELH
ncbi:heterokaryon incompatibility protein-domain-containing protein [Colletotrichum godetiae]|uniref:Heterokaryon incompatibility protein-domain-containing protein n=1 Tax=Colletotrichum godetiae TaxID=1209918 RepID=A0AAJ0AJG1_9PEZI|nr:heterokaryon incompatibility protein-domain-containing protein [Colletotrichum godetiae]KAK1674369.1 heterokaryon incompatibility protein-domain-containing protein [Colletotrichum godetiae]